jgi:hypothetical protein
MENRMVGQRYVEVEWQMAMYLETVSDEDGEDAPSEHQSEQNRRWEDRSGKQGVKQLQHEQPFMSGHRDPAFAIALRFFTSLIAGLFG